MLPKVIRPGVGGAAPHTAAAHARHLGPSPRRERRARRAAPRSASEPRWWRACESSTASSCSATCSSCGTGRCATRWPTPRRCSTSSEPPSGRWSSCPATTITRCCAAGSSAGNGPHPPPLGLESAVDWDTREPLGSLVEALAPARVRVAYPGIWLREDVYAIHGHYGDRHNTVPILERLGAGADGARRRRARGRPRDRRGLRSRARPDVRLGRHGRPERRPAHRGRRQLPDRGLAGAERRGGACAAAGRSRSASRAAVAGLNRAGIGPLRADVSGAALRRGALAGFAEVVTRLRVPASHVIFGHTHRAGPLPGDDRSEWGRLLNIGSWVYEAAVRRGRPAGSPYRPGFAAIVSDDGPRTRRSSSTCSTGREAHGVARRRRRRPRARALPRCSARARSARTRPDDRPRAPARWRRRSRPRRAPPTPRRRRTGPSTAPRRRRSAASSSASGASSGRNGASTGASTPSSSWIASSVSS